MKLAPLFCKICINLALIYSLDLLACSSKLDLAIPSPTYNLNSNSSPKLDIYVSRDDKDNNDCDFFVTFSKGNSPSYNRKLYLGNSALDFQLASDPQFNKVLMDFPELNNDNNALTEDFHGAKQKKLSYRARLETPLDVLPTGTYSDTFTLSLYRGRINGPRTLQTSGNVTFFYNILSNLSLSLVDSGAPYDPNDNGQYINFGSLEKGEQQTFDIIIKSNTPYRLSLSSQNNGRMKHQNYNSYIDYRTQINGNEISLGTNVIAASGNALHDPARLPVRFIVGEVAGKAAGQYQDLITVTVTANN